jgi:hypothetical protein
MPVPAVVGRVKRNDHEMTLADLDVPVASGTPVPLDRLIRLDAAHLDRAESGVPIAACAHPSNAHRTSPIATANAPTTSR